MLRKSTACTVLCLFSLDVPRFSDPPAPGGAGRGYPTGKRWVSERLEWRSPTGAAPSRGSESSVALKKLTADLKKRMQLPGTFSFLKTLQVIDSVNSI